MPDPDQSRMDAEGRVNWRAKVLPVSAATCTVNGYKCLASDPAWAGMDFSRLILREKSTIAVALLGPQNAWSDHHLDVPWCHPDYRLRGWDDGMRYRVRPRRKGWRFVQIDGAWVLTKVPSAAANAESADA